MFDRLAWRRELYENYLGLDDEEEDVDDAAVSVLDVVIADGEPEQPSRPWP